MAETRWLSLIADIRGEAALSLLPNRGEPPAETLIIANGLKAIDAWGAAALRTSIELYARCQQRQVTIGAPLDTAAWRLLYALLENDCPAHLRLSNDTKPPPPSRRPSAIVVPTIRVRTLQQADEIAEMILDLAPSRLTRALRFVAQEVPELVANALLHSRSSPTQPVLCVFYERDEDEVQLVICDLGSTYDRDAKASESLLAAVQAQPDGGLTTAVGVAAARGIDATLTLAAGNGRLYWRRGKWISAAAQAVAGFTAALTIPIAD